MAETKGQAIVTRLGELKADRHVFESTWLDLAKHVLPARIDTFFGNSAQGATNTERLYNAIGVWACDQLAAALMSYMANPSIPWFSVRVDVLSGIKETEGIKRWMVDVRDRIMSVLTSDRLGFYPQFHEWLLDYVGLGTATMFVGREGATDQIHFITMPMAKIYVAENAWGQVDTVYRELPLTGRQAIQLFPALANDPTFTQQGANEQANRKTFIHAVEPDGPGKWTSTYVREDTKAIMKEAKFDSFPFMVGRWSKLAGEIYGRSPAWTVLPELRMLQQISKVVLKAAQKAVDPPLFVPDNGFIAPLRSAPGSMNIYRGGSLAGKVDQMPMGDLPVGIDLIAQREQIVLRAFYIDLLRNISQREGRSPLTAAEVQERVNEGLLALTPIVVRLQQEFLSPLIGRILSLMREDKLIPDMPEELKGKKIRIEFVSPAVLAQKLAEANVLSLFIQRAAPFVALDQTAGVVIDAGATVRRIAENMAVPATLIRGQDKVNEITNQAKQDAMQQEVTGNLTKSLDVTKLVPGGLESVNA